MEFFFVLFCFVFFFFFFVGVVGKWFNFEGFFWRACDVLVMEHQRSIDVGFFLTFENL